MAPLFRIAALAILALPLASPASAQEPATYTSLLTPLLAAGETIIGQPIIYPTGTPKVSAATVTIPPGVETGWHSHPVPLFVTLIEGELSVDYGEKGTKIYKAGDSLLEAMNWPHNATNHGTVPVKILAVYMGAEGVTNTEAATAPK